MIVIGLTGGIGMGKSTVARMLRTQQIPVFDADAYVHRALNRGGVAVAAVARAFSGSYDRQGEKIKRTVLRDVITKNVAARKKLEAIIHPLVRAAEHRFIKRHLRTKTPVIVLEIPLMFETKADQLCNAVICVSAPLKVREQRVLSRPGMTREVFRDIIKAQIKESTRQKKAGYVLRTGGTHAQTERDLQTLLKRIKQKYARNRS